MIQSFGMTVGSRFAFAGLTRKRAILNRKRATAARSLVHVFTKAAELSTGAYQHHHNARFQVADAHGLLQGCIMDVPAECVRSETPWRRERAGRVLEHSEQLRSRPRQRHTGMSKPGETHVVVADYYA